ncbi:hypothetical protein [Acetobacter okinawensis]|uniref:hypothetical protein n=1 Tax=Acetobacter okinawensis TaxID=1076594 RepID=UPI0039EB8A4B
MDLLIAANTVTQAQADTAPTSGTPGWATDGNPATGLLATDAPAWHYNMMMSELIAIIKAAGFTPSNADWSQVLKAMQTIFASAQYGVAPYSATLAQLIGGYPAGVIVMGATAGQFWVSTADANLSVPGADGAKWISLFDGLATSGQLLAAGYLSGLYALDTGAVNALAITIPLQPASVAALTGTPLRVHIAQTNTGPASLNVNGLGAVPIEQGGAALSGGELVANSTAIFVFDGTAMECVATGQGAVNVGQATAGSHAMQFSQAWSTRGLKTITGDMVLTADDFGYVFQTPTAATSSVTITLPDAANNIGRCLIFYNNSSGPMTLKAGNFNTSYGSGVPAIVLPGNSTAVLVSDNVSYNGISGSAAAGSGVRPMAVDGVGLWRGVPTSGSGSSTYFTLPPGGTWAYLVSNNGISAASIAAGGANVLGPFTPNNLMSLCWRIA